MSRKRLGGAPSHQHDNDRLRKQPSSESPSQSTPLKSLLRVRLPATAKNGTIMSVYDPDQSHSSPNVKSAERHKRVLFVIEGESVNGPSSSLLLNSNKSVHHLSDDSDVQRSTKERRLSSAVVTSPRSIREAQESSGTPFLSCICV